MASPESLNPSSALIAGLRQIVGAAYVLNSLEERSVYDCDGCLLVKALPEVVVLPKNTEEVAAVVRLCQAQGVPFVPRGGGTGLSGGAVASQGGVVIALNRMNRIVAIDAPRRTATVEVGVVNAWLNRALKPYGLFYAPDPSSQAACTLGGNIAENAGGIHCIKYGVTADHILALEVVLPDGSVTWFGGATRRTHGLNLTGLMVGSEGTLGIVTQAVVRLTAEPPVVHTCLAAFATVAAATETVSEIIARGLLPCALEFMDAFTVRAVNAAFGVGFPEGCEAVLLIELDGGAEAVAWETERLQAILQRNHALEIRSAASEADRQRLWAARKGAVAAYGRILPAFYLHDCVIPRSTLTDVLAQINAIGQRYDITIGNVFHAGDGNLHPNILFDPADAAMVRRILAGGEEILKVCLDVGGTLSGEHGIGLEKSQYMPWVFSAADLDKMQAVKGIFDPQGRANPGKIFPVRGGCGETRQAVAHPLLAQGEVWI